MIKAQKFLKKKGHRVLMPVKAKEVDYWSDDNISRVEAKKKYDAILAVNITKGDIENYIGANTSLEMGFAHYRKKKIFAFNPLPNQKYILDEIMTIDPVILHGDLSKIR